MVLLERSEWYASDISWRARVRATAGSYVVDSVTYPGLQSWRDAWLCCSVHCFRLRQWAESLSGIHGSSSTNKRLRSIPNGSFKLGRRAALLGTRSLAHLAPAGANRDDTRAPAARQARGARARASGRRSALGWSCALVAGGARDHFAVHGSLTLTLALVLIAGVAALPFSLRSVCAAATSCALCADEGSSRSQASGSGSRSGVSRASCRGTALPSRPRAQARRASAHLAARGRRVQGRRAPSRLCVPALARRGSRSSRSSAASTRRASCCTSRASSRRLRSCSRYEAGRAVFRSTSLAVGRRARAGLADRVRAGQRRRVHVARAAGDGGASAARARGDRALLPLRARAVVAGRAHARGRGRWTSRSCTRRTRSSSRFRSSGFALARALVAGADCARASAACSRSALPVLARLRLAPADRARDASHNPSGGERGARRSRSTPPTSSCTRRRATTWLPGVVARTGRSRSLRSCSCRSRRSRRGGAGARSCSAARCSCSRSSCSPFLFPRFSDLVSLSQSRRAAGFVPFAFALVGGAAVLARVLGALVLPVALAAGIVLQLASPGDFGTKLDARRPGARRRGSRSWGGLAGSSPRPCSSARRRGGTFERPGRDRRAVGRSSSSSRSPCTASRTGTRGRGRTRTRSRRGSCGSCARRAEARRRLRRSRDELPHLRLRAGLRRERPAGACRGHEGEPIRLRGAHDLSASCGRSTSRSRAPTMPAGSCSRRGEHVAAGRHASSTVTIAFASTAYEAPSRHDVLPARRAAAACSGR